MRVIGAGQNLGGGKYVFNLKKLPHMILIHFPLYQQSPHPYPANLLSHEWQEWNLHDVEFEAPAHLPQSTWTYREERILEQNRVPVRKEESGQRLQGKLPEICVPLLLYLALRGNKKKKDHLILKQPHIQI